MEAHTIPPTIRRLRLAQGLTQEEVARALGVSATAVSKWERGATLPDLALLAPLARLLGTDLNELMAFDRVMDRQALSDFLTKLSTTLAGQGVQAGVTLARAQLRQYPRDGALALNLALCLTGGLLLHPAALAEDPGPWIEDLCRQAARWGDPATAAQANVLLFDKAMDRGDHAQAAELLEELPPQPLYSKPQLQARLAQARGDRGKAGELLEGQLLQEVSAVQATLLSLMDLAAQEGRQEDLTLLAQRAGALGEDFDLSPYAVWSVRLQLACLRADREGGITALEHLLSALETPWPAGSSPFRRYLDRQPLDFGSLRASLLSSLADPTDDTLAFLRDDPRFQALLERET